jgi:penicillin-binding protein 1A
LPGTLSKSQFGADRGTVVDRKNDKEHEARLRTARGTRGWGRILARVALITLSLLMLLTIVAALALAQHLSHLNKSTPDVEKLLQERSAQPSVMLSASGTPLATFKRGHYERVSLEQVSPYVIQALIAVEDHRFYEHRGLDLNRTLGAAWYTLRGSPQGGSTITQQLVRNLYPKRIGRARTMDRKLREMLTALKIERTYSKREILEAYLNSVPFLYQVTGIEMAARTYYDKSAAELDVMESATLVGMLKGTSYYNPLLHPQRAQQRRNVVLSQMVRRGMLDSAAYRAARARPLQVQWTRPPEPLGSAPHFAAHVRRQLIDWAEANDYNIYSDGLTVHSTLDDGLQEAAAAAVARQAEVLQQIADVEWSQRDARVASRAPAAYAKLRKKAEPFSQFWNERPGLLEAFVRESPEFRRALQAGATEEAALERLSADERYLDNVRATKTRLEAGFVALDPRSGEVKAWIGSRDFERDQFDHVAQAQRQPGSTFKPFVYGAAMERGMLPELLYPDGKVEIPLADGGVWRPTDMSGFSGRMMTLREGLIFSKNTITAQVSQDVGVQQVIALAQAAGIRSSRLRAVPSLALGTSPVSLLEMAAAYATIAQVGQYRAPLTIKRITDRDGKVVAEFGSAPEQAMSEQTAVELIDMLRGVVRQGTGVEVRSRFNITADIAGKTGTTQNNADGWFMLMHPQLVAGAWVGFNDQRVTMRSNYWGQGGHNAVLLIGDFFRDALKARLIDATAQFPKSDRPPLMVHKSVEYETRVVQGIDLIPEGYGVISSEDGETAMVVAPDGVHQVEGGAQGVSRLLGEIARPETSAQAPGVPSSGASATSTVADAGPVAAPRKRPFWYPRAPAQELQNGELHYGQ